MFFFCLWFVWAMGRWLGGWVAPQSRARGTLMSFLPIHCVHDLSLQRGGGGEALRVAPRSCGARCFFAAPLPLCSTPKSAPPHSPYIGGVYPQERSASFPLHRGSIRLSRRKSRLSLGLGFRVFYVWPAAIWVRPSPPHTPRKILFPSMGLSAC